MHGISPEIALKKQGFVIAGAAFWARLRYYDVMTLTLDLRPILQRTILCTLALGVFAGCSSIDNFDVPVDAEATIPAATILDQLLDPFSFGALERIDFTQELENQGVTKSDVDSVHLESFSLTIKAPSGQTFDFMDSISFSVETDGQPTALVAKLDSVPNGATNIDLAVEKSLELAPYVIAPSMRMTTSVQGKRPMQETKVAAHLVFDLDVNVTGN